PATGYVGAAEAGARPRSTPRSTRAATSSSAASTGSSSSARWPPATPNAPPTTAPNSPSPRSSSGSAIHRTRPSRRRQTTPDDAAPTPTGAGPQTERGSESGTGTRGSAGSTRP